MFDLLITKKAFDDDQILHVKFRSASDDEVKAAVDGDNVPEGYVAGWASTDDLDDARHVIARGAFSESIKERGLVGPRGVKLLLNHKHSQPAGIIKKLEYRGAKLWIEAQLNLAISYARDAYEATKMNGGLNFSVGFRLRDWEIKGEDTPDEHLLIKKGDLHEVSIVTFPMNESATMEYVKSRSSDETKMDAKKEMTLADFEKALVATGIAKSRNDAAAITRECKAIAGRLTALANDSQRDAAKTVVALDSQKLDELSDMVSKMKAMLVSPVESKK